MLIVKYIVAIVLFCIIILFHEFGHFLLAKANDIRVNEFCLGFGPTIVGFTKGETKYSLKLLPFGGACMMEGEDSESDDERSFQKKSVWARISVVAAGPIFNFIMALAFSMVIIASIGVVKPVVGDVMEGYSAAEAGLQAGDEIVKIGNKNIHFYKEVSMYSIFHEGEIAEITYVRDGEKYTTTLTPTYDEESGRYLYGIYSVGEYTRLGPAQTLVNGIWDVKYWIQYTLKSLEMLVTNQISVNDLSGPVGIVKTIGDTYEESLSDGYFYVFLNMLNIGILLSANLGVMNLLPLPALDGGRLVFLVIEAIRRKRIAENKEGMVHFIGLMCLFALMILVMFNDVRKLFI
ncbi:MAG: RIP metalloprotease RseP [Clostridiales bacterium]|nr:RIP metalloprotease RseP [Clostridiales bacterium]MCD8133952.1 RIP metalloprotease RseP [Clostridiales bacterium]